MSNKVKRYTLGVCKLDGMSVSENGEWCRYSEADKRYREATLRIYTLEKAFADQGICPKCLSMYSRRNGSKHCLNNVCLYQDTRHKDLTQGEMK